MSQLVWTPAAKADIQKHYDYLYPRNADSAFSDQFLCTDQNATHLKRQQTEVISCNQYN